MGQIELNGLIKSIIEEKKTNTLKTYTFEGKVFQVIFWDEFGIPFVPETYSKPRRIPLLMIWKCGGEILHNWHNILRFIWINSYRPGEETKTGVSGYFIERYYVKDISHFNAEQALAILDGSYRKIHTKFSDIFSDNQIVFLTYRDAFDGLRYKMVKRGVEWYFYVKSADVPKMLEVLGEISYREQVKRIEPVGEWTRVYTDNIDSKDWNDAKKKKADPARVIREYLRGRVNTYEADVSVSKRYAVDNNIKIETDLKILYFDIETDDSTKQIDMERNPILSIGAVDSDGNEHWKSTKNEKELIAWWMHCSLHYDLIIGYNSYNFDVDYIFTRGKMYNLYWHPIQPKYRIGHIDMMKRMIATFGRHSILRSYALDYVSKHFLGEGKVEYEGKIIDLFNNNRKKLKEYNLNDCWLLKRLDEKLGVSKLMVEMCNKTGSFITLFKPTRSAVSMHVAELLDMYILRTAKEKDIHYPTAFWDSEKGKKFEGGYVMEPVPGIYRDVYVFDFKSLYPSIIWTFKISPENLSINMSETSHEHEEADKLIKTPNDTYFHKNEEAIFPYLVNQLMDERKRYKKLMMEQEEGTPEYEKFDVMQKVSKEICNAMYGAMGQRGSRYFDFNIAGSVTAVGRYLIKKTREILETKGYKVVYGDTDSVFVTDLHKNPNELAQEINKDLDVVIKREFNVDNSMIEIEYETKYKKFISIKMKNYSGLKCESGGHLVDIVAIKGLDCVRRTTIKLAREKQKELLTSLLRTDKPISYYINWIKQLKEDFYGREPDVEDIVIKTAISKSPYEYKNEPPHVRVAKQLIKQKREFYVGMQIPYIISDKATKAVVHLDDYDGHFDRNYYWERIFTPLNRLLSVCYPTYDWKTNHGPNKTRTVRVKKARCPNCGYVRCRCDQTEEEEDRPSIYFKMPELNVPQRKGFVKRQPPPRKSGFKVKKTKFNILFDE